MNASHAHDGHGMAHAPVSRGGSAARGKAVFGVISENYLLAREDQPLLVGRDALLVLDLGLDVVDRV